MPFFDELQTATQTERAALQSRELIVRALGGRLTREEYLRFLTEAYHHVKHTVPLLMSCGGRLPARHDALRRATAEYIEEEIGHEEWILNDIAACGGDPDAVRRGTPRASTEMMVAYAYHQIDRGNPVGFFGMVHVLEGTSTAVATEAARVISQSLDLPPQAFSYLNSHGSLDLEHVKFFEGLMNTLQDDADRATVIHCARRIYALYGAIFDEVRHG